MTLHFIIIIKKEKQKTKSQKIIDIYNCKKNNLFIFLYSFKIKQQLQCFKQNIIIYQVNGKQLIIFVIYSQKVIHLKLN